MFPTGKSPYRLQPQYSTGQCEPVLTLAYPEEIPSGYGNPLPPLRCMFKFRLHLRSSTALRPLCVKGAGLALARSGGLFRAFIPHAAPVTTPELSSRSTAGSTTQSPMATAPLTGEPIQCRPATPHLFFLLYSILFILSFCLPQTGPRRSPAQAGSVGKGGDAQ